MLWKQKEDNEVEDNTSVERKIWKSLDRDSMNFFHLSLTDTLSASLPTLCTPKSYSSLGIVLQDEGCPRQQYLLFLSV